VPSKNTSESESISFFELVFASVFTCALGFLTMSVSSYVMYWIVGYIATFSIMQPIVIYLTPYTEELQSIVSYLADNF